MWNLNDPYEYDKVTGHYFCKGCGNNYLLKVHKEECEYDKRDAQDIRKDIGIKSLSGKGLVELSKEGR